MESLTGSRWATNQSIGKEAEVEEEEGFDQMEEQEVVQQEVGDVALASRLLFCRYKKNLKALYVVHPTNFIRLVWNIFKPLLR